MNFRPFFAAWVFAGFLFTSVPLLAQDSAPSEHPANFLFRDKFFLSSSQKVRYKTVSADGLLLLEQPAPEWNSTVALVSDFAPQALRTRTLKDIPSVDKAKEWIHTQKKELSYEGIPIVGLPFPAAEGRTEQRYWVGDKSFASFEEATREIAMIQSLIRAEGGDFSRAVALAKESKEPEMALPAEEVKTKAQFEREEEIAFRWIDQMEIGEKLFGPFQGDTAGEPILYQSFGEGSFRTSNLAQPRWNSWVGFWTNRLVFKGIHFPLNTLDPYVEVTGALEGTGNDGGSQLDTSVGFEWRPLARSSWLENYRPWGLPLLKFAKNYRFFMQYFNRRNLKDEIANISDEDFRVGFSIFYEWGIDLPSADQGRDTGFIGFLTNYVWGEYFGEYAFRHTNFTTEEKFNAWILDSSIILGVKTPPLRLPSNPVNDELSVMPYFRFGLTANTELSNPFDNKYFVAVGVRWMPFRNYRYVNNEWLFKTKFFAEYLGIGNIQCLKQDHGCALTDDDWRIGVSFSLRRF